MLTMKLQLMKKSVLYKNKIKITIRKVVIALPKAVLTTIRTTNKKMTMQKSKEIY